MTMAERDMNNLLRNRGDRGEKIIEHEKEQGR